MQSMKHFKRKRKQTKTNKKPRQPKPKIPNQYTYKYERSQASDFWADLYLVAQICCCTSLVVPSSCLNWASFFTWDYFGLMKYIKVFKSKGLVLRMRETWADHSPCTRAGAVSASIQRNTYLHQPLCIPCHKKKPKTCGFLSPLSLRYF